MSIRAALTALCLLALAVPAVADAAAPRSAQRFADAALRYREALRATRLDVERGLAALETERCDRVIRGAPRRHRDQAVSFTQITLSRPFFEVSTEPTRQFVLDLEAIPTNDPVLRSGRAGHRDFLTLLSKWPRIADPCGALERWAAARWDPDALPALDERALRAVGVLEARATAKIDRGARRLRALGVPPTAASRFADDERDDPVFDAIIEKHLGFLERPVEAGD